MKGFEPCSVGRSQAKIAWTAKGWTAAANSTSDMLALIQWIKAAVAALHFEKNRGPSQTRFSVPPALILPLILSLVLPLVAPALSMLALSLLRRRWDGWDGWDGCCCQVCWSHNGWKADMAGRTGAVGTNMVPPHPSSMAVIPGGKPVAALGGGCCCWGSCCDSCP